ncbi:MAG: hypothetical protein RLN89_03850 [Parvibaculum sp.]
MDNQNEQMFTVTVEELVVYQYRVKAPDAQSAEAAAVDMFASGELPNNGPCEGEQHDLRAVVFGKDA